MVTRRDDAVNGPVNLIFAQILGIDSTELSAQCIAMLGWVKGIGAGKGTFPLAVGDTYVPPPGEELKVTFNSNNTDTGCWQSFDDPSTSANDLKKLVNGTTISPAIKCDDYINVTNGVNASVLGEVEAMFEAVKNSVATHDGVWTVILPVISSADNYVGAIKVKGFCALRIEEVNGPPGQDHQGHNTRRLYCPGCGTRRTKLRPQGRHSQTGAIAAEVRWLSPPGTWGGMATDRSREDWDNNNIL